MAPDGSTNIPGPKIGGAGDPSEALLKLAIGRFSVKNGLVEVENRGKTAFEAQGRNLNANLAYDAAAPRYRGRLSLQPLELNWAGHSPVPVNVDLAFSLERNRVGIEAATLASGDSRLAFSGSVDNLAAPGAKLRYDLRLAVADAARVLRLKGLEGGRVRAAGETAWSEAAGYSAGGALRVSGVNYRDSSVRLRDCSLEGTLAVTGDAVRISRARVAGSYLGKLDRVPASGSISTITIRPNDLTLAGVALQVLNGEFRGNATARDLDRFSVSGRISGVQAKRAVAVYSREPIPWNAQASGEIKVEGSLSRAKDLELSAGLTIGPEGDGAPVHGEINARYSARTGALDFGRSSLVLPASRANFSGVLDQNMRVRLETGDLNDLLPAVGQNAASFPVSLSTGGRITFDGGVTGNLDQPRVAGRLTASHFRLSGRDIDSLEGSVMASPENVRIDNGTAVWKSVRAHFNGALSLAQWKPGDSSQIFGNANLQNAAIPDLLTLAGAAQVQATGRLSATAQFSGTVASPLASGDFDAVKGAFQEEPFDRFTGHLTYTATAAELSSGVIRGGDILIRTAAAYRHPAAQFDSGRLHFQVETNTMAIARIATLAKARPGLQGSVLVKAAGDVEVLSQGGKTSLRLASLEADGTGDRLALNGQSLGSAHVAAHSQGDVLKATIDANLADSAVHGEGQWKMEGDYPGAATITVASFDFDQLRPWLPASMAGRFSGSADGQIRVTGPATKPALLKAELRLPKLNIVPSADSGVPASVGLRNSGPIVATLANSVVTIESAHLAGTATDITVTGKARLDQKNPLDLRIGGRVDLNIVHDFDRNLEAAGIVSTDATVRGDFAKPQISGRMEFQNAAFSVVDLPNGISGANGLILFTGDRATIQNFSGETGGGKIELAGFASYAGGPLVFHVRATANAVRVRYPEGVSTVANANLRFTGTTDHSNLSGSITILRTGFNIRSDFSSLIAQSAEPVQTPSARTGLLGGLNFDIQITTSPDIQFESSLTQDLQVEANLRLRGTATNPALLGRVNVTHGQVIFYGSRFNVSQGSVSFYNPLKVEPILDVDLETKARGIDITLTVSGPLNKLNLTPRSDPPLQFSEIVALLATGHTPTSDPTLLAQQATAPNTWQQTGASALLGQAIASPVAGRLQRFFGVSKLRIDPTLPGVENNPQARLTLEQQITPDITFTYITNVTSSNPLVVRVEWTLSKQWSVVALREENGVFGMDFYYRKQF